MATESFAGNGLVYTLANAVQEGQVSLVDAFVNGSRVFAASITGAAVTLSTPGYSIDSEDTVKHKVT